MSEARPNPVVQAAFSDVPYILDSIWRWAEFNAYRLGVVTVKPPNHTFAKTNTTPWPFFATYVVISSFVVFGPTFTTLCQSFGLKVAEALRIVAGLLLILASLGMLISLSYEISSRLVRRAAQDLAKAPPPPTPRELAAQRALDGEHPFGATVALALGFLRRRWKEWRELPGALAQVRRTLRTVDRPTRIRLITAFFLLLLGAGVVIVPFALAGYNVMHGRYDSDVCANAHDTGRGLWQVALFALLVAAGLLVWGWREPKRAVYQLIIATVLWAATAGILFFVGGGASAREATGGPYPQTFFVLLGALLLVVFAARFAASLVMSKLSTDTRDTFRRAFGATQLFYVGRTEPELSGLRILAAILNGVVYHPLQLLLLPSLFAVMLPSRWLLPVVSLVTAYAVMLLAHGSVSQRWEELIQVVQRWFLNGSPLFVSIGVITLAILRLLDWQYVTTILDAAPVGIIAALIVGAYMTLWFAEYWINRWIAERLLGVLGAGDDGRDGFVTYPYQGSPPRSDVTILPRERVVALQSIGEFCVQGVLQRSHPAPGEKSLDHAFTTYRLTELFDRLAPGTLAANDIRRRVKTYFAVVNVALILVATGLLLWQRDWNAPLAAYRVVHANEVADEGVTGGIDLAALLAEHDAKRPALIVAASGGGTRAALYTATALQGLARIDRTRDIVLLSGVSGGGVAVAYYASHPQLALGYDGAPQAWETFKHVLTEPFIEDVLDGVGELRIAANAPLGELLAESFERRVFTGPVTTFSQLGGPALILNTTISGHPWPDSEILRGHVGVLEPDDPCVTQSLPFASLAGSRLIFTNLRDVTGFPHEPMVMPDVGLFYKIVRDPTVSLARAAALNANFPPVFSNARVRLAHQVGTHCVGYSYFVTDGGATENLGLVSALYELRGVLTAWHAATPPPQIDVIAIEASAITYDYTDDRGVGAATGGAKERINGGLTQELIASLNLRLQELHAPPLRLHYLPLPIAFRSRGGFGTHWMYADTIRVSNPLLPKLDNRLWQWALQRFGYTSYAYVDHEDICQMWTDLFDPHTAFCPAAATGSKGSQQVSRWICGNASEWNIRAPEPDPQVAAWTTLIKDLGEPPPGGTPSPVKSDTVCKKP